jgi:hypothetical protein
MSETVDLVRLTVPQAEAEKDSRLFVLNKSTPTRGNINFNITDISGQRIGMRVPVTWVPLDLTNFGQKSDIIRNPDFRRMVAKNMIHIVSAASAEAFLSSSKAEKELNRILDINVDLAPEEKAPSIDKQINAQVPAEVQAQASPFIQNIILRSNSEPHGDLITELEGKLDTLSIQDVEMLMNNTSKAEIKTWAGEALAAMR